MENLSINETKEMLIFLSERMIENKEVLCKIDGIIGDGDHGFGIERGFREVKTILLKKEYLSINDIFKDTGTAMLNSMGGASGVIFSRIFLGVSGQQSTKILTPGILQQVFREGLDKIKQFGKANKGDKTMIDSFEPAVEAMEKTSGATSFEDMLAQAEIAAHKGLEETKSFPAKFGRAKFLGERSIGHQDAGATSVWLMMKAMHTWFESKAVSE